MKKIILNSLILVLLIVCFTSCSTVDNNQVPDRIFMRVPSESDREKISEEFEDAENYGLYASSAKEIYKELEGTSITFSVNGEQLTYSYSECTYSNKEEKVYGTYYSIYDYYKGEGLEAATLHGTDLICLYFDKNSNPDELQELSSEEAKDIADSFVLSILSQKLFSEFECISFNTDTSGLFAYIANYSRKTCGYTTDETLSVYVGKNGKVTGYNGYNVGKYDTLKEKFDNEKIDSAATSLIDKINSLGLKNVKMNNPIITTDADGLLYVKIDFSYEDDYGNVLGETVLVNVI